MMSSQPPDAKPAADEPVAEPQPKQPTVHHLVANDLEIDLAELLRRMSSSGKSTPSPEKE